jgi:hypothetical protein
MSSDRFFSVDSPKAIKAQALGWLNAINYMAPAASGGAGNLCPHASPGCLALCLGWYSGQAGMISNAELETGSNATRASRVLTFSRSETNEAECLEVLRAGGNVAVVFAGERISGSQGGDLSDLRHLDERGGRVIAQGSEDQERSISPCRRFDVRCLRRGRASLSLTGLGLRPESGIRRLSALRPVDSPHSS